MDKPLGPRQPDKRHAAYESIFGRPSASHHHTTPAPPPGANLSYSASTPSSHYPALGNQYPYPQQQQQQYQTAADRRTSYSSSYASNGALQQPYLAPQPGPAHHAHPDYPQSYYSLSPQPSQYSVYQQPAYQANPHGHGIAAAIPQPEDPPDANIEALTRQGLTPAQAYQAHVYLTSPMGPRGQHNGAHDAPRIGLNIDADNGRLGIDFTEDADGSSSPSDETSSSVVHPALDSGGNASTFSQTSSSTTSRRSSESARTAPISLSTMSGTTVAAGSIRARDRTSQQDRSRSMSAATSSARVRSALLTEAQRNSTPSPSSRHKSVLPTLPGQRPRRTPTVYPALLSRVAAAFRTRITLADRVKDGLTYTSSFDGRQAVDKLAYIIKTTDRNLALLLGRALDAQKWFHAVTYDHRLRDSAGDLYQFKRGVVSPFVSAETVLAGDHGPREDGEAGAQAITRDGTLIPPLLSTVEETAFRLIVLLQSYILTKRATCARGDVWEVWSQELVAADDAQELERHVLLTWSDFVEVERSSLEIEECLWCEFPLVDAQGEVVRGLCYCLSRTWMVC
ncbi:hypothetical protein EWM64_g1732 [Hericium alpestre]|uniref:DEP domain-containing protein n=1 Tax=Hericium alpestre TaxID=135208 RepID=A0A4Z0A721_9AGAM|nr:hypothetical protein EWM64_g1732 [Hericium alpestre]